LGYVSNQISMFIHSFERFFTESHIGSVRKGRLQSLTAFQSCLQDPPTDKDERGDHPPPTARQETSQEEKLTTSEQPQPEKEEVEEFRDVFEARMVVHQALHLPLLTDCQQ